MIYFHNPKVFLDFPRSSIGLDKLSLLIEGALTDGGVIQDLIDIEVSFVSPDKIKVINLATRDRDEVTDVLSFEPPFPEKPIGEIYMCLGHIEASVSENIPDSDGSDYAKEFLRLLIHGVLHVYGMEHEGRLDYGTRESVERMFRVQEDLVEIVWSFLRPCLQTRQAT